MNWRRLVMKSSNVHLNGIGMRRPIAVNPAIPQGCLRWIIPRVLRHFPELDHVLRNILLDLLRSIKGPGARPGFGRVRDGFWWRKLSDSARVAYVIGYLDALEVGRAAGGAARASDAEHSREKTELDAARVTAVLDEFFANSDNWHMALPSAMFYVIKWQENPDADHSELLRRLRGPSGQNRA